jgi:hypothetical protein
MAEVPAELAKVLELAGLRAGGRPEQGSVSEAQLVA